MLIGISLHDKQGWQNFARDDFIGVEFHIVAACRVPRSVVPLELTFERALPFSTFCVTLIGAFTITAAVIGTSDSSIASKAAAPPAERSSAKCFDIRM